MTDEDALTVSRADLAKMRDNWDRCREANNALWVIALVRVRCDPRTRAYVARRTAEGLSKKEIIRCLKRYIAREVFSLISHRKREINRAGNAA